MSTVTHQPSPTERHAWSDQLRIPEMWASIAITAMWVAVIVAAIWGPDMSFSSNDGSHSTIPSAVIVTIFAFLGSWVVARYGLGRRPSKTD
jgi:hypothetical protein